MITKVSVIVPCLNAEAYIRRCIESILEQGQWLYELIVCDGNSSDKTLEILQTIARQRENLIVISTNDHGQSDAMNRGLAIATGDVIGFVNADDWLFPGALKLIVENFDQNSHLDIVVGGLTIFQNGYHVYRMGSLQTWDILDFTKFKWPLNPVSYFCARKTYAEIGPFPLCNHNTMDYWFLLRAGISSRSVKYVDAVFGAYWIHGQNKSQLAEDILGDLKDCRSDFLRQSSSVKTKSWALAVLFVERWRVFVARVTLSRLDGKRMLNLFFKAIKYSVKLFAP